MEPIEIHECEYKYGKITDVTIRDSHIYCRMCGKELLKSQINEKDLKEIENKESKKKRK